MLACVGILCTTGYYWNILEPPGTYTTLYEPSWILLDAPCPQYLKCKAALMCSYPPFIQCIHMLWGPRGCVGMRWHSPYYWILLEHTGTTSNLYDPIRTVLDSPGCALPPVPEMHSCTDATPPFIQYIHMLWGPRGCVGMRRHSPYYWILLENIGTTWNLYDPIRTVLDSPGCALPPVPETHSSPFSYNTFTRSGVLWCVCVGMRWHSPYYWILLEHIGTAWNLYDPIRTVLGTPGCALPPVPEMHSCTDVQLPPPFIQHIHMLWEPRGCVGMRWHSPYYWILLEHIGTTWNIRPYTNRPGFSWMCPAPST